MPANANCSGATPFRPRASKSGAQAAGACSVAAKKRSAKRTSSCARNVGSSNATPASRVCTPRVTARYSRVKQATPSAGASGDRIASMRAMTAATGAESLMNRDRLRHVERFPERVQVLALRRVAEEGLRRRLAPRVQIVRVLLAEPEVRRADRMRRDADCPCRDDVLELFAVPG